MSGYNYDTETQEFTIDEEEAQIVRYVFERYVEGSGAYTIAKELTALGYKPFHGKSQKWGWTTVIAIIKNVRN